LEGDNLTNRQREVIRLTSLGCTIEEIAAILGVSCNTVDNHRSRAMSQLGIHRLAILTRYEIQHGISPLDDQLTPVELKLCRKAAYLKRGSATT
jgi:DNA-binding CsgD family transcriptional regulator